MDEDALLKLAREDYDRQDKYSEALGRSGQFILALGTVVATASIAMFRSDMVENGTISGRAYCFFIAAALLWIDLFWVWTLLARSLWKEKSPVPRTIDDYLTWRKRRKQGLLSAKFSDTDAASMSTNEMAEDMLIAYANSACVNREINLKRQRIIAKATTRLIVGTVLLGLQASFYCAFLYGEVSDGRIKAIGTGRQQAGCTAKASPSAR